MHTASKRWSLNDLNIYHVIGYIFISKKEKLFYQAAKKRRRPENCTNILSFGQMGLNLLRFSVLRHECKFSLHYVTYCWLLIIFSLSTAIAVERTSSLTLPCICKAEVEQRTTECAFAIPHNFIVFSCYCSVDIFYNSDLFRCFDTRPTNVLECKVLKNLLLDLARLPFIMKVVAP